MGGHSYNFVSRSSRTVSFKGMSQNQRFEQQDKRMIHDLMIPAKALLREARDSEVHPETLPIILGLDVTGSMQQIPNDLITEGLPTFVSKVMGNGVKSPSILFTAIGDSKNDNAPLQVGQFESGDEQLDMWLRRVWIEGNGGGNGGESYLWAWYYAANHVVTDAWEKRKQKGFLFTIGDEPCHNTITDSEFRDVMGITHETTTAKVLFDKASEKWNCFHLALNRHGNSLQGWKDIVGENLIVVDSFDTPKIPEIIAEMIKVPAKSENIKTEQPDASSGGSWSGVWR